MSETAKQAYGRIYGEYPVPDTGGVPLLRKDVHPSLVGTFFWDHVRLVRSHAKDVPLKPRKRLPPEGEARLRRDLEMMIHQARHALSYLARMDELDEP